MRKYKYKGNQKPIGYIASISEKYRYFLETKGGNPLLCICLNPSNANKNFSDLTTQLLEKYTGHGNYGSIALVNLYPFRETIPKHLPQYKCKVHYEKNLKIIKNIIDRNDIKDILIAPGSAIITREYLIDALIEILNYGKRKSKNWYVINLTQDLLPYHPRGQMDGKKLIEIKIEHLLGILELHRMRINMSK
ncbi:MAG: DUF1643 domain-containing protein [Acholeplasmataceae bacterium]|jgi:hypothetical protein